MPAITVNDAPVPKARPRLGNGRVFTPRKTELAEHRIRDAWLETHGDVPMTGPLMLMVTVRLTRPKAHYGARGLRPSAPKWPIGRPDWDNFAKTACDALNGVAYRDDAQIVDARVIKEYTEGLAGWGILLSMVSSGVVE